MIMRPECITSTVGHCADSRANFTCGFIPGLSIDQVQTESRPCFNLV